MNKRIKKKHEWLGTKIAGANHCANEIAQHIWRKLLYAGITPKPSYVLNVRRHVRWFFHHSSEEEWTKRAAEAYYPKQMFFSAKHLLPADYDKVDKLGSSYGGVNYPYPERWTYPENTHLTYIDGPEKSLAQWLQEEYDERRKKLIDKIKNEDVEFNNIGEDGGPTMDYRIQSYADYGAHGPIEPIVLAEEEEE